MFFIHFSSGQTGWYVGPLLLMLPLVLPYEVLLDALSSTIQLPGQLLGIQQGRLDMFNVVVQLICLVIFIFGLIRLIRYVRNNGGLFALLRLLFLGAHGGFAAQGQGRQPAAPAGQQRRPARATLDQVAAKLRKLRTEVFASHSEVAAMTVQELKERIRASGRDVSGFVEKRELVDCLLDDAGNSSSGTCCICSEDYVSGDVLRVLSCAHKFHIECVDRWLLACDFSRPPACPMCNAELFSGS